MRPTSYRTSFYSRKRFPKETLLRFVRKDGKLVIDPSGKLPGRGAYLSPDEVVLALKEHAFVKAFHYSVSLGEEEAIKKAYEHIQ
jgi:predicted RNA-binding protein YlxR (DUF448 family)